ncbi:MAG: 4-(cytidine 5'-diphospho)-2-C-methyl-D-erythritol kinase [Methylococcaceae bacterium]
MSEEFLRLPAPAKLNLMLRVVGRRPDGYHLLQTVFQFVTMCDVITLKMRKDDQIRLLNPLPDVPECSDLTVKAAHALREATGILAGVDIHIEKNIPMGGGLGGGSSDAATVLLGLNRIWQTGLSPGQLARIGLRLGADVPVFIEGHSAWAEGVGEQLTRLPLPEPWYVIVCPQCNVSTAQIFNSPELTRDNKNITIADFLAGSEENHCLPVVTNAYPEIKTAMEELRIYSTPKLTGTGACVFAGFKDKSTALQCRDSMAIRWSVHVTQGCNVSPLHVALENTGQ